jgi:hypothetical protein
MFYYYISEAASTLFLVLAIKYQRDQPSLGSKESNVNDFIFFFK